MVYQKKYEFLIAEIELLMSYIEPYNDSLIEILPPLFDEIQEIMPDKLFAQTAPLLKKCRYYVSAYQVEELEKAPEILKSLKTLVSDIKQISRNFAAKDGSSLVTKEAYSRKDLHSTSKLDVQKSSSKSKTF